VSGAIAILSSAQVHNEQAMAHLHVVLENSKVGSSVSADGIPSRGAQETINVGSARGATALLVVTRGDVEEGTVDGGSQVVEQWVEETESGLARAQAEVVEHRHNGREGRSRSRRATDREHTTADDDLEVLVTEGGEIGRSTTRRVEGTAWWELDVELQVVRHGSVLVAWAKVEVAETTARLEGRRGCFGAGVAGHELGRADRCHIHADGWVRWVEHLAAALALGTRVTRGVDDGETTDTELSTHTQLQSVIR
jgi:hypothetical protein